MNANSFESWKTDRFFEFLLWNVVSSFFCCVCAVWRFLFKSQRVLVVWCLSTSQSPSMFGLLARWWMKTHRRNGFLSLLSLWVVWFSFVVASLMSRRFYVKRKAVAGFVPSMLWVSFAQAEWYWMKMDLHCWGIGIFLWLSLCSNGCSDEGLATNVTLWFHINGEFRKHLVRAQASTVKKLIDLPTMDLTLADRTMSFVFAIIICGRHFWIVLLRPHERLDLAKWR